VEASSIGRPGPCLKRVSFCFRMDLMPRFATKVGVSRGRRNDGGRCKQFIECLGVILRGEKLVGAFIALMLGSMLAKLYARPIGPNLATVGARGVLGTWSSRFPFPDSSASPFTPEITVVEFSDGFISLLSSNILSTATLYVTLWSRHALHEARLHLEPTTCEIAITQNEHTSV